VPGSPLFWFAGYYQDRDWSQKSFTSDGLYYLSGDSARMDAEGYITFNGRADDLIKSAGYRIGPFEVESALVQHHAVAEAAVVGLPDSRRGQTVAAYVVLRPGMTATPELEHELSAFAKS
jgi:acetyl-CoA synthetase